MKFPYLAAQWVLTLWVANSGEYAFGSLLSRVENDLTPEPEPAIVFPGKVSNATSSWWNRDGRDIASSNHHHHHVHPHPPPYGGGLGTPKCSGACLQPSQCISTRGLVKNYENYNHHGCSGGLICCEFANPCNHVSTSTQSFFNSPAYPEPTLGNVVCQYDLILQPGICGVRLEFIEFNTTEPLDRGICNVDQFLVMNSLDGPAFSRCGDLTGYSTIVPVDPRHKLPLTLVSLIQSSHENFKWNVKLTQIKCRSVQSIQSYPNCGRTFMMETVETENEVKATTTTPIDADSVIITDDPEPPTSPTTRENTVDNAFYVAYLKHAYEAIVNSTMATNRNNNNNDTLCQSSNGGRQDNQFDDLQHFRKRNSEVEDLERIIRGDEALPNEFPWQVSIQDGKGHACGGAIVSPVLVLTAAHCYMSVAPLPLRTTKVVIGDLNFNDTSESESETVEVSTVVFHSHFDPYYLVNDIALIKLKNPLTFRAGVQPLCLPEKMNSYVGQVATVSGWGATTYPHGKLATTLQKAKDNRIIENSECKKKLKIQYLYETMICAVGSNCTGTCFGDSGGPLILKDTSTGGSYTLVGLVSFGIGGCAFLKDWPDVYTRVSSFLDWIAFAAY